MSGGDDPWEKGIFTEHGGGAQQALGISIFNFLALRLESDDQFFYVRVWGSWLRSSSLVDKPFFPQQLNILKCIL